MFTKIKLTVLIGYIAFFSNNMFSFEKSVNQKNIRQAIEKGVKFLYQNQNATGWWTDSELPALTGLALVALKMSDVSSLDAKYESERRRAYDY